MQLRIQSFYVAVKVAASRKPMFLISTRIIDAKLNTTSSLNDKKFFIFISCIIFFYFLFLHFLCNYTTFNSYIKYFICNFVIFIVFIRKQTLRSAGFVLPHVFIIRIFNPIIIHY
jgi:hypothetical protein